MKKVLKAIMNFFEKVLGTYRSNKEPIDIINMDIDIHIIDELIPRENKKDNDIKAIAKFYHNKNELPKDGDIITMEDTKDHYIYMQIYEDNPSLELLHLNNFEYDYICKKLAEKSEVKNDKIKDSEVNFEEEKFNKAIEETLCKEEKKSEVEYTFKEFSDEEVNEIREAIRPVIKNLNNTKEYCDFCKIICENKLLKTFIKVSEDKKHVEITLTQNCKFNEKLADYVRCHAAMPIFAVIKNKDNLSFDITDYGIIILHKMVRV